MQHKNLSITSIQTATYTSTNAWANVPQFIITVPEDGVYDLKAIYTTQCPASHGAYTRFAINGNPIEGTQSEAYVGVGVTTIFPGGKAKESVPLKAADVVSMQCIWDTADATINYSAGLQVGSLTVIKRGV